MVSREERLVGESRKLRFAQAGVAAIHASMYRDTLQMLSDEIELVGFYDPEPEVSRARIKPDAAHVPFYGSIGDLIDQAKPDAVLVSGYCRDMPGWMLEVAEAGVHVWAEKPFALHSDQLPRSPRRCAGTTWSSRAGTRGDSSRSAC
jgi:predicted dehydrogenase